MFRHHSIGRTGKHHRDRQFLVLKNPAAFTRQQIVARHIHLKGLVPLRVRKQPTVGAHRKDGCGVHNNINSAKLLYCELNCVSETFGRTNVDCGVRHSVGGSNNGHFLRDGFGGYLIHIGNNNMRPPACQQQSHFAADAASASNDQRDLTAELSFGRHALQLGFFQRPVFDAERFRTRQGHVVLETDELF